MFWNIKRNMHPAVSLDETNIFLSVKVTSLTLTHNLYHSNLMFFYILAKYHSIKCSLQWTHIHVFKSFYCVHIHWIFWLRSAFILFYCRFRCFVVGVSIQASSVLERDKSRVSKHEWKFQASIWSSHRNIAPLYRNSERERTFTFRHRRQYFFGSLAWGNLKSHNQSSYYDPDFATSITFNLKTLFHSANHRVSADVIKLWYDNVQMWIDTIRCICTVKVRPLK